MKPVALAPLLIRATIALAGAVLVLTPSPVSPVAAVVIAIGTLLAATLPTRAGVALATLGFLIAWLSAYGAHGAPPVLRTLVAALALYVLHTGTALAAFVPLDARVETAVLTRYAQRCVAPLLAAAAITGLSYALPRATGSAVVELAGLVGVLILVAVPAWLLGRRGSVH